MNVFKIALSLSLSLACLTEAHAQIKDRVWKVGEDIVEGRLVQLERGVVDLKTMVGESKTVLLANLSEDDQQYLRQNIIEIVELDREQFLAVATHVDAFIERPSSVIVELRKLEGRPVRSPYASLMVGVARSVTDGDHGKTVKHFKRALEATKTSRKFLGSEYHRATFDSAINNIGVCCVKRLSGDIATKYFEQSFNETDIAFVIHHNTKVLSQPASKKLGIKLRSKSMQNLAKLTSVKPRQEKENQLQLKTPYFLYSLDWDAPPSNDEVNRILIQNGLTTLSPQQNDPRFESKETILTPRLKNLELNNLFPDLWCTNCSGIGAKKCGARNCINGNVLRKIKRFKGIGPNGRAMYMDEWVFDHKCRNCRGTDSIKCPHCTKGKLPAHP